ncbi:9759_t:CDS:2 [Gigaspora margarita]|uniref:9759_t:CDS:1 n=1 Tax=Gigaspora margarita TaxID=4874 RepID=A0ABN7UWW9_GIGMA|nr:9759_t:CDS:2 [Gigaspora margarita]
MFFGYLAEHKNEKTLIKAKAKGIVRAMLIYMLQATRLSEHELQKIHRPLLKLIKNKAELQVTTSTSLLKHKSLDNCTETLATELRLRQGFNDTRIAEELKFHFNFSSELWQIEQDRIPLNVVLEKLITWSQLKLCKKQFRRGRKPRWFIALKNCLIGDRRNRKLVPEYVISGYNSLALSIALLAVSLDKRKKELVLVKNKDNNRKIFKIVQKGKAKILGEHYCNIPLADPNQFEIKKCKGCSRNTAKMTGKVDEELEQNFGYAAKKLYQGRKEDFELG